MAVIKTIRDFELRENIVFIRVDFNVPIADGVVTDDTRIREALPTIKYAIEKEAKIVLASHLGRPRGPNSQFSLEPVAEVLAKLLDQEVTLADDCIGEGITLMVRNLKPGEILLLQNLRFHTGEEKNDPEFVRQLFKLCDIYINDAFGAAHRKHASTYGLPEIMEKKGMGLLMEKEVQYIGRILDQPTKPFHVLLGGAKVSDKIKTIESLLMRANAVLVGGAMANAFLSVKGETLHPNAKKPSAEDMAAAKSLMRIAKSRDVPLLLPIDTIDSFDIGPQTIELFKKKLTESRQVFWNGPLGWFEKPEYANGTFEIARFLADHSAVKVVGGGDTVAAVKQSGVADKFDHLSTGGGAVLEYLESGDLPGVEILKHFPKRERRPEFRNT